KNTVVLNEKYKNKIAGDIAHDSTASIQLKSYKPNHLIYESSSQYDQFAVFSEIFFEDGWNAYIDGKKTEYFRANYVLRSMNIPGGRHTVEFKFEPESYYLGRKISRAGSALIIIFVLGIILYEFRTGQKTKEGDK
ncbi:MAG: YfhO family protein, partial [Bacteroidales bacterium]